MINDILKYSEFTCGVILAIFALIQLAYRNRHFVNLNIAGLYLCLSYVILSLWSFKSGFIFYFPWLIYTDIATAFLIGPFVFFYLKSVLGYRTETGTGYYLHFLPGIIIFTVIVINNIENNSFLAYYSSNSSAYPEYNLSPVVRTIDSISSIYMISYFIAAIKRINIYIKKGSHKSTKELYALFYYMFFIILFSLMMLFAGITGNPVLNISAIYLLTLAALWYFIFSFRYPEFTQKAIREAKAIRYESSMLKGIDPDAVMERLDYIMEEEKLYTDYELTLNSLSSRLMITPHQLSRILNSHRKINFRTLINSYRIKESMRQMAEHPDKTILEIAFACGFNSKSSFNSVFLKFTGKTPTDFRSNPGEQLFLNCRNSV